MKIKYLLLFNFVLFSSFTHSQGINNLLNSTQNNEIAALDVINQNSQNVMVYTINTKSEYSKKISNLKSIMFNENILISKKQIAYSDMLKLANNGDSLAMYYVGLYMLTYQHAENFDSLNALTFLKKSADQGQPLAQNLVGEIYQTKTSLLATEVNMPVDQVKEALDGIGVYMTISAAKNGIESSYLRLCNIFVVGKGGVLKNFTNAAQCYENTLQIFNSSISYGLLANLYLYSPEFNTKEYETKGINIAYQGVQKGDLYCMALLGRVLINPKFSPQIQDVQRGIDLINYAAQKNDPTALKYKSELFERNGNLKNNKSQNPSDFF